MDFKKTVYLDNSATTRISDVALAKYNETSLEHFGNPSSLHALGFEAEKELREARRAVCDSLMAKDADVVFTASGSEANNLAITGRANAKERYKKSAKIITTLGEHASVSEPLRTLAEQGFKIAYIPTLGGKIDMDALEREMTGEVILVTMMMVNNETGAMYDIKRVSEIMRKKSPEAILHVDATQSYLKLRFTMKSIGADMITISSHKIHGPKGVGALVIDPKIKKIRGLAPIIFGGGQEGGLRSGTENVPGIAAFGAAVREGTKSLIQNEAKLSALRAKLVDILSTNEAFSDIVITNPESHAPHILNVTLPSIKSETMLHFLSSEKVYVSSGSACSSNSGHHSSALIAYGKTEAEADTSIRISFSSLNTEEDVECFLVALEKGLKKLARIR